MNRGILPDVDVEFDYVNPIPITGDLHVYDLIIKIKNSGSLVQHYQLDFSFRYLDEFSYNDKSAAIEHDPRYGNAYTQRVIINSETVLFPSQVVDFSKKHRIRYRVTDDVYWKYSDTSTIIVWILYADKMQPKTGEVEFQNLNKF